MTLSTPLLDYFRRGGDVPADVRLLAARGLIAPRAHEQVELLLLLRSDSDAGVASAATDTLNRIPDKVLASYLARTDVSAAVRQFFSNRTIPAAEGQAPIDVPLIEEPVDLPDVILDDDASAAADAAPAATAKAIPLSMLPVPDKIKLAMRGNREQRGQLVRDSNKLVAVSVLASPKLTETEVESFARMGNVSEEVLRLIGTNRAWVKNYGVMHALTKNPKTPLSISLHLMPHLNVKDVKRMLTDRNLPEQIRLTAKKLMSKYTPH